MWWHGSLQVRGRAWCSSASALPDAAVMHSRASAGNSCGCARNTGTFYCCMEDVMAWYN